MNGRAAKIFRKLAKLKARQLEAPDRDLCANVQNPTTALNHPATARAIAKGLKKAYRKGLTK